MKRKISTFGVQKISVAISVAKFRETARYFSIDLHTCQIAALSGLNRHTIHCSLHTLGMRMVTRVYMQIVADWAQSTLQAIIRGKVELESVLYSARFASYVGRCRL